MTATATIVVQTRRISLLSTHAGPFLVGEIGRAGGDQVRAMAESGGGAPEVLRAGNVTVCARGAVRHQDGTGLTWSHWPLSDRGAASSSRDQHDVVGVDLDDGAVQLHGAMSGALPVYVDLHGDRALFSSSLEVLIRARGGALKPDWDGLLEMVTASGPLGGRTTVAGIRRLGPGESLVRTRAGDIRFSTQWSWPEIEPGGSSVADLAEALRATVDLVADAGPVTSMLSGGWDSRLLLALAYRKPRRHALRAFTTSSDTGTVMEELVAAQVAEHLAVPHQVVMPERAQFAADLADFASAADYQTAFHVWLVPLARAVLASQEDSGEQPVPTTLDGLGGGLFVGSSFADDQPGSVAEQRMAGITKYLPGAERVLVPAVARQAAERIRADAEATVQRYLDHPYGHTLTAYLTRTVPGISLAPHALMAGIGPVATPFLSTEVVSAALALAPAAHAGDRLYPVLTGDIDPVLASLATAQEQVPWPRPHPRRVTSIEAVRHLRSLVLREPVRALVAPTLIDAGPAHWRALLSTTGGQHLLRGLAVLSLWCETHQDLTAGLDLREVGGQ